jgi:deoxyribonuclease V
VAKRSFLDTPEACEVLRGSSEKPLFVTAVGMPLSDAKQYISVMHGKNRIPSLLKKVDQLCRGIDA